MAAPVPSASSDPVFLSGSLQGNESHKTKLIGEVFSVISDMIGTLQSVAASQANRLTYYANLQQAYTNLMGNVPTVTNADLKHLNLSSDELNTLQNQATTVNQALTNKLQNYRDVVTDKSQSFQSVVNQSNQEVSQQGDLATSLLQELSTILTSLYTP